MPIKYVNGKKVHLPYPKKTNSTTRRASATRPKSTTKPTTRPA